MKKILFNSLGVAGCVFASVSFRKSGLDILYCSAAPTEPNLSCSIVVYYAAFVDKGEGVLYRPGYCSHFESGTCTVGETVYNSP